MSRAESINAYRPEGESLAQTRERLRAAVDRMGDVEFATRLRNTEDGLGILAKAVEGFGSRDAVRAWSTKREIGLGNYAPAELITNEDVRQRVIEFLNRMGRAGTHDELRGHRHSCRLSLGDVA